MNPRTLLPFLFAFLLAAAPAVSLRAQETARAFLTIGPDDAWIQEEFPSSSTGEVTTIRWQDPPPGLDLSSLQVWGSKNPAAMRSWCMEGDALRIDLAEPLSHRMGHTLLYRVPGWSWRVRYDLDARLSATLFVSNPTPRAFPSARIAVHGPAALPSPAPTRPIGIVDVKRDTPLSDPWRTLLPDSSPDPAAAFSFTARADIDPAAETEIPLFTAPVVNGAESLYVLDASAPGSFPSTPGREVPLRRHVLVPNTERNGAGRPLPPGLAFIGGRPAGRIDATPHPGNMDFDLGDDPAVRASRRPDPPDQPLDGGHRLATRAVDFRNDTDLPARVRFLERPLTPYDWTLDASSVPPSDAADGLLDFTFEVPPRQTHTLTYTLHLDIPDQFLLP